MIPFNKIFGSLSIAETTKKNQRRVALIFLIRIWILIVRDINFSVTKDKRLFYNLYTSGNFFFR